MGKFEYRSRSFLSRISRNLWVAGFSLPTVVVVTLVLIYPICFLVSASFKKYDILRPDLATFIGLSNFIKLIGNKAFLRSVLVTIEFTCGALLIQVFFGTLIGISISGESRTNNIIRGIILIPMMITPVVSAYMWKMMLDQAFGLVNYFIALLGIDTINWLGDPKTALFTIMLIDSWIATPFMILIIVAAIVSLPQEPFEAAKIDGATEFQATRLILIPMISRLILIAAILRIMSLMKVFGVVYAATGGGPGDSTEVVNILIYQEALSKFNIGLASAMAVILMLVFAVIVVVYIRLTRVLE